MKNDAKYNRKNKAEKYFAPSEASSIEQGQRSWGIFFADGNLHQAF